MSDLWEEEDELEVEEEPRTVPTGRKARRAGAASGESRGNWYLLTGMIIGVALGLIIAWVISPVQYVDTDPSTLASSYKEQYRLVIALAYNAERDLEWARARLNLIDPDGTIQELAAQAQRMLAENQSAQEARALTELAAALSQPVGSERPTTTQASASGVEEQPDSSQSTPANAVDAIATPNLAAAVQTATVPIPTRTPTITPTRAPTFTPRPTATPMQVLDAPFVLVDQREVCDGSIPANLMQVFVSDADGNPLPGVRIAVTWQDGEDIFYSGLTPEIGPGYADFQMDTGIVYDVKVGEVSDLLSGLKIDSACGLRLELSQQN